MRELEDRVAKLALCHQWAVKAQLTHWLSHPGKRPPLSPSLSMRGVSQAMVMLIMMGAGEL